VISKDLIQINFRRPPTNSLPHDKPGNRHEQDYKEIYAVMSIMGLCINDVDLHMRSKAG